MQHFSNDGFDFAFVDRAPAAGDAEPVLLIHGFASSAQVNWVSPGWRKSVV